MMRALWTASSGMLSQQTNLDTIANNLSNINTLGYKKEVAEFKSLLYQTLKDSSTDSDGNPKTTSIQVGSGVRNSAITAHFIQGPLTASDGPFDIGIQGEGFFMVRDDAGQTAYTRNGHFDLSVANNTQLMLCTSDGNAVLSNQGTPIMISREWDTEDLMVDNVGRLLRVVTTATTTNYEVVARLGIAQFNNKEGLSRSGGSLLYETNASGPARVEGTDAGIKRSTIKQGYLESSNVQAVDEMVNMIVAQRAYEMNSKIITASDEMLQQANNLRR